MTKINLPEDFVRFEEIDEQIGDTKITGFRYKDFVTIAIYQNINHVTLKFKLFNTDLYNKMEYDDQRTYTRFIRINNDTCNVNKVQVVKIVEMCEYLYDKYKGVLDD